tara:strand:+ start:4162 stop:4440 length:279 start_codon:yes stop_codon:yes gene_type:complete
MDHKTDQLNLVESIAAEKDILSQGIDASFISIEIEIKEQLFSAMKDFISNKESIDQNILVSKALSNFLHQNGCEDRAVTERYLNDVFNKSSY